MMREKKILYQFFSFLCIFAMFLYTTPCSAAWDLAGFVPFHKQKANDDSVLRIGMFTDPTIIHPLYTTHSKSVIIVNLVFSFLVRFNDKGTLEPDLATRWEVSPDGMLYTFYLRNDVYFHDGVKCTAADVKFTYDAMLNSNNKLPFSRLFSVVEKVEAVNETTVRFYLKEKRDSFFYLIALGILPKHLLAHTGIKDEKFIQHPVGSGPYAFKEKKGSDLILERNDNYFAKEPHIKTIIFKRIANIDKQSVALLRNEIDMATFLPFDQFYYLKDDPYFKAYAVKSDYACVLRYDLSDPALSNIHVRQALAYGISQQEIIDEVFKGYAQPCYGPFYPGSGGFNSHIQFFDYDPAKAAVLLEQEGYAYHDGSLYREKDGNVLELRVVVNPAIEKGEEILKSISVQLAQVGIKVTCIRRSGTMDDFYAMLAQKKGNGINTALQPIGAGKILSDAILDWCYYNNDSPVVYKYVNKKIETLVGKVSRTTNANERNRLWKEIHKDIYADQPATFLIYFNQFHAINVHFGNTDAFFTLNMPTHSIGNFTIVSERG